MKHRGGLATFIKVFHALKVEEILGTYYSLNKIKKVSHGNTIKNIKSKDFPKKSYGNLLLKNISKVHLDT